MDIKQKKKNRRLSNLYIAMWVCPVLLVWLVIILNYFTKGRRDILNIYIYAMLFVLIVFLPGIIFNIILKKKGLLYEKRKRFIFFFIQLAFMGCAFIGLVEGGLDAAKTTEQVKQVIQIIKNAKRTVYLDGIEIELELSEEYHKGDVIDFSIKYTPERATEKDIIVEIDNKIVNVDLSKNTITCLENGTCNIKFIDSHNHDINDSITIVINSISLEDIILDVNDLGTKDLFLEKNEEYQLHPIIVPSNAEDVELKYISENTDVAIVDANGLIKGIKAGTAKIICYDGDIFEEIYVTVDPITEIEIQEDLYSLKPGREFSKELNIIPNNIESFNIDYLEFDYNKSYDVNINYLSIRPVDKKVVGLLINNEYNLEGTKTITVNVSYNYPGGTIIDGEEFLIELVGYQLFDILDIDTTLTNTNVDSDIYYDSYNNLVANYISVPIYYNNSVNKGANNFLFESTDSSEVLNFDSSSFDNLIITFNSLEEIKDSYEIRFYPNKDKINDDSIQLEDKSIVFTINVNKVQTSNDDASFEMTNLYKKDEGKNEIWFTYFNETLFNDYSFTNDEFANSGLYFEFDEEFKEKVDIEINELGYVSKATLKDKVNNWYIKEELTLKFKVCSLYEYNKNNDCEKVEYIINVINEYDGLEISIEDNDFAVNFDPIIMKKGEILSIEPKYVNNLEYKGTFQVDFSSLDLSYKSSDETIVSVGPSKIQAVDYGKCEVTFCYYSDYYKNTYPITLEITVVNDEGIVPNKALLNLDVINSDSKCPPILEERIFAVGTILGFSTPGFDGYEFSSSDSNKLEFMTNGQAKCKSPGNVTIAAYNSSNVNDVLKLDIKIYSFVEDFTIKKGNFIEIASGNAGLISVQVKTNKRYAFELSKDQSYQFINTRNNNKLQLDDNGGVLVTEAGQYYVDIIVGEEDSPYRITKSILITSTDDGVTANFRYFIRKAIGHFGLFFVTGIFACIALLFINCFKIKNKYIVVAFTLVFGAFLAFSTEYMQKTDPSRFFSFNDILLDFGGYLSAFVIIFGIFLFKELRNKRKLNKEE